MSWLGRTGRMLSRGPTRRMLDAVDSKTTWPPNRLIVLTYHRIDDPVDDGRYPGLVSASPREFERQMTLVADRYHVVSIDDVLTAVRGERSLPPRSLLLTFDDAVDDFESNALPVLSKFGLPGVVFVPTEYAGADDAVFWWDAVHAAVTTTARRDVVDTACGQLELDTENHRRDAYRRLRSHCMLLDGRDALDLAHHLCEDLDVRPPRARVMGWDRLRRVQSAGIACCPHTRSHAHLDHLDPEEIRDEVEGSLADLRRELPDTPPAFAYPAGRVTAAVRTVVRESGIELAFTTQRGGNLVGQQDPMSFRRINVSPISGFEATRLKMLPVADRLVRS